MYCVNRMWLHVSWVALLSRLQQAMLIILIIASMVILLIVFLHAQHSNCINLLYSSCISQCFLFNGIQLKRRASVESILEKCVKFGQQSIDLHPRPNTLWVNVVLFCAKTSIFNLSWLFRLKLSMKALTSLSGFDNHVYSIVGILARALAVFELFSMSIVLHCLISPLFLLRFYFWSVNSVNRTVRSHHYKRPWGKSQSALAVSHGAKTFSRIISLCTLRSQPLLIL